MKVTLKFLIRVYQFSGEILRWFLGGQSGACCRFTPSCSEYASQALDQHGVWKGSALTVKRVCKCHPWGSFGYDPVPQKVKE